MAAGGGTSDPVLVGQLVALIHGLAQPQMQSVNDTPDPTVTCAPVGSGGPVAIESAVAVDGPSGTELRVGAAGGDGWRRGQLVIMINRVLQPDGAGPDHGREGGAARGTALRRLAAGRRNGGARLSRHRAVYP